MNLSEVIQDRFLDHQLKILVILSALCITIVSLLDWRWLQVVLYDLLALLLSFLGGRFFEGDTSENWLGTSIGGMAKNAIGGASLLIGWTIFLEKVLSVAVATILLRIS